VRLTSGSRLGPYEVLSTLGTGGMAEVYRARDTRLGRDIALKVVNEALASNPELVRRFEKEARLAGSLNHPNLVAVYDVGLHEGAPYFITELLDGESLRHRLSRGRIPIDSAVEWGAQLAQGLAAAHARGIVHRDVKPENVFVTSDGHVKLLDFGIAKLAEGIRAEGPHGILDETVTPTGGETQTGAILGTPAYMAPEQVRGEHVDARTDIFSLGAVLYEMLSGQRPFPGGSLVESGHAILHENPAPLPDEVPMAVAQVVRRCLEKEPGRRLQSATDLAFALELLRTPTATVRGPLGQSPSTKRLRLIALAGAMLLLGAVGALLYVGTRTSRPALPQIEQATFREGVILGARFTPEGQFVLSASWDGQPEEVFSSAPRSGQLQALGLQETRLLGVSRNGELAVVMRPQARQRPGGKGTLARVPAAGGVPRELAEDIILADWSPSGELTAVRVAGGNYRIERPLGRTVYETSGGDISALRVSPNGDDVAFIHHPAFYGPGEVTVLDAHNTARVLTRTYANCEGLAWNPSGTEVWFTAGDLWRNTLRAAPLKGSEYEVYRSPGAMRLEDVAADGTILFTLDDLRREIFLLGKSGTTQRNLSWGAWGTPVALSDDGQLLAFDDAAATAPETELILVRRADGSPPKILGEGRPFDLSADKKTVLALAKEGLVLLPVGPGIPRKQPAPGLEVQEGRLFRDGKRLVVAARPTNGRERRVYLLEVGSDAGPRSISETALSRWPHLALSPDERWVAAWDGEDVPVVLPIAGGTPIRLPELSPPVVPIGWSAGGDLWLLKGFDPPAQLIRVDLGSHQIKESRSLSPADPTGVMLPFWLRITPDGSTVVYTTHRVRSRLFVMRGVGVAKN
jgi:eukaryotic-like serine/threonine-protein kinase